MGYWVVGLAIGGAVVIASPLIATRWIHAGALQPGVVKQAGASMGILLALQWPISLYQGGLLGLQRQVLLNGIAIAAGTLRGAGAAMVLWFVSPTVTAFFTWQIIVTAAHAAAMAAELWRSLPHAGRSSRVNLAVFWRIRTFAGGLTGMLTSLSPHANGQGSTHQDAQPGGVRLLHIGRHSGVAVTTVAVQVFNGVFPRFATQVAAGDKWDLARLYHQSSELLALLIFPAGGRAVAVCQRLAVGGPDPIGGGNRRSRWSWFGYGALHFAVLHLPHALQLAYGWTSLCFLRSLVSVVLIVPVLILMIRRFGAIGAASSWLALNLVTFLVEVPIMHRRLLRGEMWRWYGQDLGLPMLAAGVVAGAGRWLNPHGATGVGATPTLVVFSRPRSQVRRWPHPG